MRKNSFVGETNEKVMRTLRKRIFKESSTCLIRETISRDLHHQESRKEWQIGNEIQLKKRMRKAVFAQAFT